MLFIYDSFKQKKDSELLRIFQRSNGIKVMNNLIVYPKNKNKQNLLESMLKEIGRDFEVEEADETQMTKDEFYAKIEEAREGKVHKFTPELEKELFGDL